MVWTNFINLLSQTLVKLTDAPTKTKKLANSTREIAREVGGQLFDEKWSISDPANGEGRRDVMSLLGKVLRQSGRRTELIV